MAVQVLGKVAYFNKGAYNSQTNYEINDVVSYNGSSYVSLNDNNQGNLPTNTNYWSVVAEKGDKGDTGKPFVIEKTYSTIESMVADYDNMNVNDYVMIQGSIEEQENATLWTKREVEVSPYKWAYLADFSGASGITGATPNIHIGTVTEGNEPSVTRRSGSSNENPILDFVLKTGAKGDTGATGNGISSIEKTSTSGLVDTYTITFTNGTSTTIEVTNGRGIVSIAKTGSVDYVDTYTITYNDGTTSTFEVANSEVTEEEFNDVVDELSYLYDDLPKVEGEGTNLTLNNTRKGKIELTLKGNTYQKSTSGKNLFDSSLQTTSQSGITCTANNDGTYTLNGTATSDVNIDIFPSNTIPAGTYKVVGCPRGGSNTTYYLATRFDGNWGNRDTGSGAIITFTNFGKLSLYIASGVTFSNAILKPMITTDTSLTYDDYEPYTNGASPNPDYPQDVDVVSGDNTIKVEGKNLCNGINQNLWLNVNASSYGIASNNSGLCIELDGVSDYTISSNVVQERYRIGMVMVNPLEVTSGFTKLGYAMDNTSGSRTISSTEYKYLIVNATDLTKIQIEKSSSASTYTPYVSQTYPINLGTIELCKIGDYEDKIAKSSGKNLFDKDNANLISNRFINFDSHAYQYKSDGSNNRSYVVVLNIEPNTTYTISKILTSRFAVVTSQNEPQPDDYFNVGSQQNNATSITIKSGANDHYLTIWFIRTDIDTSLTIQQVLDSMMVEKNTSATPYEPYGKVWCLNKQIGKVVLDGSEDWVYPTQVGSSTYYRYENQAFRDNDCMVHSQYLSDNFKYNGTISQVEQNVITNISIAGTNKLWITIDTSLMSGTTKNDFKNWLSTHNTTVYYVLATPTYTEITDQTLIAQLDNFEKAKSYNTQTNISQENNDLPFIISASAFMSLKYLFGNLETRVAELETSEPSEL